MVGWHHHVHDSMDMSLSKLCEVEKDREAWRVEVRGVAKSWTQLIDCMTTTYVFFWFQGVLVAACEIFGLCCGKWDL